MSLNKTPELLLRCGHKKVSFRPPAKITFKETPSGRPVLPHRREPAGLAGQNAIGRGLCTSRSAGLILSAPAGVSNGEAG